MKRPSIGWSLPEAVAIDVTAMSLIRIAIASPTSAPSTATGRQTSWPPRIDGVIIGPQQPGVGVPHDVAAVGDRAEHLDVRPEQAVGERVDEDGGVRGGLVLDGHGVLLGSAAGDRQQQGDLLAMGEVPLGQDVLARHDGRAERSAGASSGWVVAQARVEVRDRGAVGQLDGQQRRGGEPGEPRAQTHAHLHAAEHYRRSA